MIFKFYKEDTKWYVDLPKFIEEGGDKADLEMIAGADDMLDMLSSNGDRIELSISLEPIECRAELTLLKAYEGLEGSDYSALINGKKYEV